MVPSIIRRESSNNDGLRPLSVGRDWHQVIALIEVAFGDDLDIDARRALQSMRLPPLLAPLIGVADNLSLPGEGMMPGFVWLEGGRVVGTASVRRVHPYSDGWLISNVAVHPNWRGHGIGRDLLEASLDYAQNFGGSWIVLQVRDNNLVAQGLYKRLGFRSIAEIVRLHRPTVDDIAVPATDGLRSARLWDSGTLYNMARSLTPSDVLWPDSLNRDLYRTGALNRLAARLRGVDRRWWVLDNRAGAEAIHTHKNISVGIGLEKDKRAPWNRLRLVISPQARNSGLPLELISFGLSQLADAPRHPVEIEYPAADTATQSALIEAGFERIYSLIHMRLEL